MHERYELAPPLVGTRQMLNADGGVEGDEFKKRQAQELSQV